MAYNEVLASRIERIVGSTIEAESSVTRKKMFGGLAFMLNGNMWCGVSGNNLMLRVGPDRYEEALGRTGAREMDFTGKALRGFVYVDPEALESDAQLAHWLSYAHEFVSSLQPK